MYNFCFSQDLGKIGDYHGQILTEFRPQIRSRTDHARQWDEDPTVDVIYPEIIVRGIDRNQMNYNDLVEETIKKLSHPRLVDNCYHVVDATGVGLPTIDFMRKNGLNPIGIWFTGGQSSSPKSYGHTVPKVDLVNALQVALSGNMIKFSQGLNRDHIKQLLKEFKNFKEKVSKAGNKQYEAWREDDHDDLVLSLAINVWWILKVHGITTIKKRRFLETADDYNPLMEGLL